MGQALTIEKVYQPMRIRKVKNVFSHNFTRESLSLWNLYRLICRDDSLLYLAQFKYVVFDTMIKQLPRISKVKVQRVLLKWVFCYCTFFSSYSLGICQNSIILAPLERFQAVKFKSEKRCKNKKEEDKNVKILHFY